MAVLKRARWAGALGLVALVWLGCDLGLDPSMIGESASSGATSSSSGGGEGGATSTTTSSASGGGGGAGGAGAGGGGGAGGEGGAAVFGPCAPIDDFTDFLVTSTSDSWEPTGKITAVTVNGNGKVRAEGDGDVDAAMVRTTSSSLEGCYQSVRVEPLTASNRPYLSLRCGASSVRFTVDRAQAQASVSFTNPPVAPPSAPPSPTPALGGASNLLGFTMRVRFTEEVSFEVRPEGAATFTTTHSFPRPSWMNDCTLGFGLTAGDRARFDDFCVDAP